MNKEHFEMQAKHLEDQLLTTKIDCQESIDYLRDENARLRKQVEYYRRKSKGQCVGKLEGFNNGGS